MNALRTEKFLRAAQNLARPLEGTYIHDAVTRDHLEKTDMVDAGYGVWLQRLLRHLRNFYRLRGRRVLDFGCGTGEFTVRMRTLGYQATGLDAHADHIEIARILARENGMSPGIFVLSKSRAFPLGDDAVDLVTLFSVLEHLDDSALDWIIPELRRVCRGVMYVLVPNRTKIRDDHTGLAFVPWMPRSLVSRYVALWGRKHGYHISRNGRWDVTYRSLSEIESLFKRHGLEVEFPPVQLIYPSLQKIPPIRGIGKRYLIAGRERFVGIPFPVRTMTRLGVRSQVFHPYLNLILVRKS